MKTGITQAVRMTDEQVAMCNRMGELRLAVDRKLENWDATNPPPKSYWWASMRVQIGRFSPEAIELRRLQMAYVRSLKAGGA